MCGRIQLCRHTVSTPCVGNINPNPCQDTRLLDLCIEPYPSELGDVTETWIKVYSDCRNDKASAKGDRSRLGRTPEAHAQSRRYCKQFCSTYCENQNEYLFCNFVQNKLQMLTPWALGYFSWKLWEEWIGKHICFLKFQTPGNGGHAAIPVRIPIEFEVPHKQFQYKLKQTERPRCNLSGS